MANTVEGFVDYKEMSLNSKLLSK